MVGVRVLGVDGPQVTRRPCGPVTACQSVASRVVHYRLLGRMREPRATAALSALAIGGWLAAGACRCRNRQRQWSLPSVRVSGCALALRMVDVEPKEAAGWNG